METISKEPSRNLKTAAIKAVLLLTFVIGAILLVRYSPIGGLLTAETLKRVVDEAGIWAPVLFIFLYAAGICLFLPGTLLTGIGAAVFGAYWGFLFVWTGAMIGAAAAFFIGRFLGRDFASSLIGEKLRKYDDAIADNGFATVLYLRLIYFPFTAMNFGMGLTRVTFRDYMLGTGLGIMVGTFIFTFFIGTLKDIWATGDWRGLISPKVFLSVAVFIFSFFIPKLIKKIKGDP